MRTSRTLRIATRGSRLARWQAERVGSRLGRDVEYVLVETRGDADQSSDIHRIGGQGVFVKEVQQAVLDGRADLAVHSAKDLPSGSTPGLALAAVPERADVRDALVGARLDDIPTGGIVGTGSVRRRAQLAHVRRDLGFAPLRGNIETRLRKQHDSGVDAIVVAHAALTRLGLDAEVAEVLEPDVLLPQVAQGALAVECRVDDDATITRLAAIDDGDAHRTVRAERAFLDELGGGCDLPCGALARVDTDAIVIEVLLASLDGHVVVRASARGPDPEATGVDAARVLLGDSGGSALLDLGERGVVTVYLVGAGPGDPGLLTRRGEELLRFADVVVYDRLAARSLLDLAPGSAARVDVGKAPGRVAMTQDEINAVLVAYGLEGKQVVRLKGGDPFVFGRGGEEAEACIAAGVPFEVVPGITSAIAAPAYAGIPVTHRGVSTSFTVVTGHEDPTKGTLDTDWDALARTGGTLVILMGAGHLADIARALVKGGRAPDTPVAAVRWGTRPDQRTVRATLDTITAAGVEAPSAIVVGDVAALELAWFEARPLFGRAVVVTRAREQASELRSRLEVLGAEVVELPAIAIEPVDFALPGLDGGWIVFTSVNGVDAFFDRGLAARDLDARALARLRIAAIGPGTAGALARRGVRADLVPERFVAESLLEAFPAPATTAERVVIARAEHARDVLPDGLSARGYTVDVLPVYRTVAAVPDTNDLARVQSGRVDAITFTSSSTVTNFCDALAVLPDPQPLVVSIGPVTSDTARARGLRVDHEADPHTIDGLVASLLRGLTP